MNAETFMKWLVIYGAANFVLAVVRWSWRQWVHVPERVIAEGLNGQRVMADIVGASKLRQGEWQRTKVRFYDANGEASWTQGDGFQQMGVMRKGNSYTVRSPR